MSEELSSPDEQMLRLHLKSGRFRSGVAGRMVATGVTGLAPRGDWGHGT